MLPWVDIDRLMEIGTYLLFVSNCEHIYIALGRTGWAGGGFFSSAFLAVASSFCLIFHKISFRSCMIMNDFLAYIITYTPAERAHIHMWESTVHVFPFILGGGGVGRPSEILLLYIPFRDTCPRDFSAWRFTVFANTNILCVF